MNLSEKNAYRAMIIFLEDIYVETRLDDLGGLLGGLLLLPEGSSADPAAFFEWKEIISSNQKLKKNNDKLNTKDFYEAVCNFLELYTSRTFSPEIERLIKNMKCTQSSPNYYDHWKNIVDYIKNNPNEAKEKTKFKLY